MIDNRIMIDRQPATDIVRRMRELGLIKDPLPKNWKSPEEIAAYKEKRRQARNDCMRKLRDFRYLLQNGSWTLEGDHAKLPHENN